MWYKRVFSQSIAFSKSITVYDDSIKCPWLIPSPHQYNINPSQRIHQLKLLTRFFKQIAGQSEHPIVQQQQTHPQTSHLRFSQTCRCNIAFIRNIVSLNSSGATLPTRTEGNSRSSLLLIPNLCKSHNKPIHVALARMHFIVE